MADNEENTYSEDENNENPDNNSPPIVNQYQDIRKTAVAPRPVEMPDNENDGRKSYSSSQDETSKISDMQATFRNLLPSYSIKEIDNIAKSVMMARIFPQNFHPLFRMLVVMVMRENPELDPRNVMMQVNSAMSIGYNGFCRDEIVEVSGVMSDKELGSMGNSIFSGR